MPQPADPRAAARAELLRRLPSVPWGSPWFFGNPNQPQGAQEPDAAYWIRNNLIAPVDPRNFGNWNDVVARPAASAIGAALDTPAARTQFRQGQQPGIADFARGMAEQVTAQTRQPARAQARPAGSGFQPSAYAQGVGQTLSAAGLPPQVVAGILGNGHYESAGWNISGSGDRGTAHGAFQWRNERADNFRRIIGADPRRATPEQTGRFVLWELQHPQEAGMRPEHVQAILSSRTPQEAAVRFSQYYERPDPARANNERRAVLAGQYAGGGAAASPAQAFGSAVGTAPPGMEAYQQWYQGFEQSLAQAQAAASSPSTFSFEVPTPPTLPAPTHFQQPDFSAGNAAFEQAQPKNPFAEPGSENRMLRQHFFRGMAEALLSVPTGRAVGFGELLMRAGAGALGGRMRGHEEVQQRMDRYDGLMQQYNMALASRNDQQARSTADIINQNIQLDNQHAYQVAERNLADFHRRNRVELTGSAVTVYRGEGNQQQVSVIPVPSIVAARFGEMRAQANTMAMNYAALGIGQGQNPAESGESLAYALSGVVVPLADSGMLPDLIGHDNYNQIRGYFEAANPVDPRQIMAPADAARRQAQMVDYIAQRVVRDAMGNPELARRLLGVNIGVAGRAVERIRSQRTTTTRSRRGTSTSTSYQASDE